MILIRPLLSRKGLISFLSLFAICLPARAENNSIEDFFRPAKISRVSLSPDGKFVAGSAPIDDGDEIGLVLINLETLEPHAFRWKNGYDIYDFNWVSDEDIVFNVSKWNTYVAGIYRINRTKKRRVETMLDDDLVAGIIDPMPKDKRYSWLWIKETDYNKGRLAKLNKTGNAEVKKLGNIMIESEQVLKESESLPKGELFGFWTDNNGEARLACRFFKGKLEYLHRNHRKEEWQALELDAEEWKIVSFDHDNETLFVCGYGDENTIGLYTYDKEKNEIGDLLFRDDYYDYVGTAKHKYFKDQLVGVTYHKSAPTSVWFAPEIEGVQKVVDNLLPGKSNVIYDWTEDFTKLLIYSYSDVAPPDYYALDLAKKEFKLISKSAPWIDPTELAKTEVMHFETDDGLRLEAYLTRPSSGEAPYPTVCLVHGGPWARDTGKFDRETQYLASLGYAVLRVNYRGSAGFGKKISWDTAYDFRDMQDDITRATQLLIENGIADPKRIAIMGGSFGGYSALCGAAFEPDLYKCAVTIVGVFDWQEMTKERKRQEHYYSYKKLIEEIGDPKNAAAFEEISPIHHVDNIKIPIFIAHGKGDSNVSVQQSRKLQAELKKRGIPFETFYREWEGHGFFDQKNRIELYKRIETFLKANL